MKIIIVPILFLTLVFLGCNQESEVTSPTTSSIEKQWISLSDGSGLSIEDTFTKTKKKASGDRGWNITFDHTFSSSIRIMGDLNCPKGAYDGRLTFSFTLKDDIAAIDFNPSPFIFDIPVEYTIIYEGLDLTGINPEDVDFYYIAPNGSLVKADYERLEVNIATGRLFVLDAKLPHFSRYGFVN
ncbi:MAG: hypothetical protein KJN64_06750 [Ignavibacteria bacterium]|nr:hypothetical protein [Ignavibacteria bacterium]MBT8382870.1 hypothetical protein [Ignavibacteria bacterium]MBT8392641.1 hypothetical protein [Ignavibacteria bacterium]NNJ51974.1 hypothetical protein [Ignavibacteriaceae bacterium]NNL22095.1 hypothetical protein [Ignavibacteriaceae bacterium]